MSYNLHVIYKMKKGTREIFFHEIVDKGILNKIREENGCEYYQFFFNAQNADEILLLERWADIDAQQTHIKQPHMDEYFKIKALYVESTKLSGFEITELK